MLFPSLLTVLHEPAARRPPAPSSRKARDGQLPRPGPALGSAPGGAPAVLGGVSRTAVYTRRGRWVWSGGERGAARGGGRGAARGGGAGPARARREHRAMVAGRRGSWGELGGGARKLGAEAPSAPRPRPPPRPWARPSLRSLLWTTLVSRHLLALSLSSIYCLNCDFLGDMLRPSLVLGSARGCPGSTCISPVWLGMCNIYILFYSIRQPVPRLLVISLCLSSLCLPGCATCVPTSPRRLQQMCHCFSSITLLIACSLICPGGCSAACCMEPGG